MTEVEEQGRKLAQARRVERKAMDGLRAVVRSATELGVGEVELARQAGVHRATIRKMLGKSV